MAKLLNIPIPLSGLNTINPFVDISSGFARELTNYTIVNGRLRMRPAVRTVVADNSTYTNSATWLHFDTDGSTFFKGINSAGDIWNASVPSFTGNIGGLPLGPVSYVKHISLDLVIGCREPRTRATPFTAWTITPISITATAIIAACSHKGRLYYTAGSAIEYTQLGQVTGAVTVATDGGSFNPADFMDGQSVVRIFSVSLNPGNSIDNYFVIIGSAGKVLIYSGDYPRSANWQLVGKYDMPAPIGATMLEVNGDILVPTRTYAYWISDLISGGNQAGYENNPTRPIENFWQIVAQAPNLQMYHLKRLGKVTFDCIVFGFSDPNATDPKYDYINDIADYQNGNDISLVYHRKYNAWTVWLSSPFSRTGSTVVCYNDVYYGAAGATHKNAIMKLSEVDIIDQVSAAGANTNIPMEATWKTPYATVFNGVYQALNNVRVFFHNSVSGYMEKVRAIFDFSDLNSPYGFYTQSTATQINPGNYTEGSYDLAADADNHYHPYLGIGGAGVNVSFQITQKAKSGSSSTQTQEVLAATAVISDGGIMV